MPDTKVAAHAAQDQVTEYDVWKSRLLQLMVLGPHTARGNTTRAIEHGLEWLTDLLRFMQANEYSRVETRPEQVADQTETVIKASEPLFSSKIDSCQTGVNRNVEGRTVRCVLGYNAMACITAANPTKSLPAAIGNSSSDSAAYNHQDVGAGRLGFPRLTPPAAPRSGTSPLPSFSVAACPVMLGRRLQHAAGAAVRSPPPHGHRGDVAVDLGGSGGGVLHRAGRSIASPRPVPRPNRRSCVAMSFIRWIVPLIERNAVTAWPVASAWRRSGRRFPGSPSRSGWPGSSPRRPPRQSPSRPRRLARLRSWHSAPADWSGRRCR